MKLSPSNTVPWIPKDISSGLTKDGGPTLKYFEVLIRFLRKQFDEIINVVNYNSDYPEGAKFKITKEGGYAIKIINATGAPTVRGQALSISTTPMAVHLTAPDDITCVGSWYEGGVPDGKEAWLVISGIAPFLLKDSTECLAGNWIIPSDVAGRFDATATIPVGGTLQEHDIHFGEAGHCLETSAGGTDIVVLGIMHFN